MPPHGALASAVARYHEAAAPGGHDPRTHLVDLGPEAQTHLTGFRFSEHGSFAQTDESADGIHPREAHHAELGQMVLEAIKPLVSSLRF